jgi:hypothetical protein
MPQTPCEFVCTWVFITSKLKDMKYLLLLPYLGLLAVPLYNHSGPELFGFPFFYWYQFAWIPLSSFITYVVYKKTAATREE